jgi:hypothetical protein
MTILVSWDPNPVEQLVSEYKVYQSYNGGAFNLVGTVAAPDTSLEIVDPLAGTYHWKVSAFNLAGEGNQSDPVGIADLPTVPTGVTVEVQ